MSQALTGRTFRTDTAFQALPIWDTWTDRIPMLPLSCDAFDIVVARPRPEALTRQHVQFNTATSLNWLIFDLDREDSFEVWERANLLPPNIYVQNPTNGHAHLLYALAVPVGTCESHRRAPIEFAAAVQRGMTRRLGADPAYSNRLAKNPRHRRWRASWLAARPFDLRTLLEPLDREDTRPFIRKSDATGLGRNCDLFDNLRRFAYRDVLRYKRTGNWEAWFVHLFQEAIAANSCFSLPLSFGEVRQIAKSVAKWTWRKFTDERFADIQAN